MRAVYENYASGMEDVLEMLEIKEIIMGDSK
jgi:hypothetical protein